MTDNTFEEFKQAVDEQRLIKLKINKCPYAVGRRFQEFAKVYSGNIYPAALALLLDAHEEAQTYRSLLIELNDVKGYLQYLQKQIDELRAQPATAAESTIKKTFGEQ